ncbi:hypothetical protein [Micromonospora sp. NPDC023633]
MTDTGSRDAEIRDLVASTAMLVRVSGREPWRELPVVGCDDRGGSSCG